MRIMCLNGWGGRLHDRLIPYLEAASPDVLCLQEVVHTPAASREWLTYRDGDHVLPQRADFFREVAAALPDHVATFCPAAQGVLWDGEEPVPSQWGLATFVRVGFPIIGQVQAFVHKTFSPDGYGDHPRPRNAHILRIFDFEKNRTVLIAHMHGLRDLKGKMDTPERLAQAHRFAGLIKGAAEERDQIVACGDFNVEPDSRTFEVLGVAGLKELVTAGNFTGTRTSHYKKAGRFADYMLVGAAVDVLGFDVVEEPEVSDHRPLLLEI
ncbi:endonuclease/exonuclease/phosphatase family protein [Chelativorans sp.]|uniref:endonuclease/exonuclease/phosphatase family protein n=1 Tax=Chelativorans sp. TaxID=2203393 RepID=UPI002811069C|nr:endonuclease/exonuclease/phosphatase family protein [Chelativorans sp.]